jgi:hypothetical protein
MSASVLIFVLIAVALIGLLAWATRPPKPAVTAGKDVLELLARQRHCEWLPCIVQALRPEDTEYLKTTGHSAVMHTLRGQRRRIALNYLNQLQEEFETLLEVSRAIAVMAPGVVAVEEMERWKLSLLFALNCTMLRWQLRLGLRPTVRFRALSRMATGMLRQLESATSNIAETAMSGAEFAESGPDESEGR